MSKNLKERQVLKMENIENKKQNNQLENKAELSDETLEDVSGGSVGGRQIQTDAGTWTHNASIGKNQKFPTGKGNNGNFR